MRMPVSTMIMAMRVLMIRVRVIMIVSVIMRDLVFMFHRVEFL